MRIPFEMGHPAHVHFFKNAIWELERRGHEVKVTARDKDVTLELLEAYGFEFENRGSAGAGTLNKGINMVKTDMKMLKIAKKFRPEIMCGILNPYTAQVSRVVGAKSITFTDTEHAKSAQKITFPFTDLIVTPEAYLLDHGEKHIRYNGFHELAYLHPDYFTPDPTVLEELGLTKDDKYAIIRFVSWEASHDIGFEGFSREDKIKLIKKIEKHAKPLITSEGEVPEDLKKYQIQIPPYRIHDALAFASLYVGEGATMASEAAMLGVPSVLINAEANNFGNFKEMEERYKLVLCQKEINVDETIALISDKELWEKRKNTLINEKQDATKYVVNLIENKERTK